jgi:hypothetical protein
LIVVASARRIQAGDSVNFAVRLTEHGQPEPNVQLHLREFSAWSRPGRWQRQPWLLAVTDGQGRAYFTVPYLWANASFQVTGPGSLRSGKIKVVVIARVIASIYGHYHGYGHGHGHGNGLVFVSCLEAAVGDTVKLEVLGHGGHWHVVGTAQFRHRGRAVFTINAGQANRTYRAVLLATLLHGRSVSNQVSGTSGNHWHNWNPPPTPSPAPSH